ncbi:MAG: SOS response-associated peptidase [Pseudoclavibacter sp.]|nr:SOS response-associated peptidase [Pseudoclavibacter sp.]
MCGRFLLVREASRLAPVFRVRPEDARGPDPSYNIAPSEPAAIVAESPRRPGRRIASARWGLVPSGRRSLRAGPEPFNARIESLPRSGLYRAALRSRRVLVPADGFFERGPGPERPSFCVRPADEAPFAFAGLAEWWRDPSRERDDPARWLFSFTIVTRSAAGPLREIHGRMPLMLPPELWTPWLDPAAPAGSELLAEASAAGARLADRVRLQRVGDAWLSTRPGRKQDDASLLAQPPA